MYSEIGSTAHGDITNVSRMKASTVRVGRLCTWVCLAAPFLAVGTCELDFRYDCFSWLPPRTEWPYLRAYHTYCYAFIICGVVEIYAAAFSLCAKEKWSIFRSFVGLVVSAIFAFRTWDFISTIK